MGNEGVVPADHHLVTKARNNAIAANERIKESDKMITTHNAHSVAGGFIPPKHQDLLRSSHHTLIEPPILPRISNVTTGSLYLLEHPIYESYIGDRIVYAGLAFRVRPACDNIQVEVLEDLRFSANPQQPLWVRSARNDSEALVVGCIEISPRQMSAPRTWHAASLAVTFNEFAPNWQMHPKEVRSDAVTALTSYVSMLQKQIAQWQEENRLCFTMEALNLLTNSNLVTSPERAAALDSLRDHRSIRTLGGPSTRRSSKT
jgi:hypothetical protein